jgi:hypothetical protein
MHEDTNLETAYNVLPGHSYLTPQRVLMDEYGTTMK